MKPLLRSLLSLAVVLAITALLLELGLRALALLPGRAGGLASDPDVGIIGMPHVANGAMVTNAQGFNDREFATAALPPKAVFVGDSFTFGVTPFAEAFPHRVEDLMGGPDTFRVVNLGVPSTGPQEYLAMIRRRALPMRPEWVVVTLFVGNDIRQAHPNYRTLIYLGGARSMYHPLRLGTRVERVLSCAGLAHAGAEVPARSAHQRIHRGLRHEPGNGGASEPVSAERLRSRA